MNVPRVSICVPVYNGAAFLRDTLKSILSQTWKDYELLVIDNASTDGTLDILNEMSDPRLKVVCNSYNVGPILNFNKCLAMAQGEFIKFVCADDVLHHKCVERQMDVFDSVSNNDVVMVNSGRKVIDASGRGWMVRRYGAFRGMVPGKVAIRRVVRAGSNLIGEPSATLLRTDIVRRVGGFASEQNFCMDLDLWCRMLLEGDLFVLPDELCFFRVSAASWSVDIGRSQMGAYARFVERIGSDARYGLTWWDRRVGIVNGWANGMGRRIFYSILASYRRGLGQNSQG